MPRRRYDDDDDELDDIRVQRYREPKADDGPLPQSGLGIVSLFISIFAGIASFATVVGLVIVAMHQNGQPNDKDPAVMAAGLAILVVCASALIGVVLGIVGSIQPDRGSVCGIIGSIFNALILLGFGALICLGLAVG